MSLATAKYIMKYTHKGTDRAMVEIQYCNEVFDLRNCKYIRALAIQTPHPSPAAHCHEPAG
jgi:hypothetical protein